MQLPFDGAISTYYQDIAPEDVRQAIANAGAKDILDSNYPHNSRLRRKAYEADYAALQIELVKLQPLYRM